jgi:urease subunit beta
MIPGEIVYGEGDIAINDGAERLSLDVVNTADRPVQVGSHVHLPQANAALQFDRTAAHGHRLDIPAGTAVRFEPGESKTVQLVAFAGAGVVRGGNGLSEGEITAAGRERLLAAAAARGFAHAEEKP